MRPLDAIVVGAGFAGLSVSRALAAAGADHVVLERDRIGESWRSMRWDSFRLNSPRQWHDPAAADPDAFVTAGELVADLARLAAGLPVCEGVAVGRVERHLSGWRVHTSQGPLLARAVVAATGALNRPRRPEWHAGVAELHAADYRSPERLPDGAVVVIGGGQSGAQIAADLLAAGRRVYLTTSRVGRVPRRYRGRDIAHWFVAAGLLDQGPEDRPDPDVAQPLVGAEGDLSYQALTRAGATLLGRATGCHDGRLTLTRDVAANVHFADEAARQVREAIDGYIVRERIDAPPPELDAAGGPLAAQAAAPTELDLHVAGVGAVVFATGFGPAEPDWLGPGVHRVGGEWQRTQASSTLYGVRRDAPWVASRVLEQLEAAASRRREPAWRRAA